MTATRSTRSILAAVGLAVASSVELWAAGQVMARNQSLAALGSGDLTHTVKSETTPNGSPPGGDLADSIDSEAVVKADGFPKKESFVDISDLLIEATPDERFAVQRLLGVSNGLGSGNVVRKFVVRVPDSFCKTQIEIYVYKAYQCIACNKIIMQCRNDDLEEMTRIILGGSHILAAPWNFSEVHSTNCVAQKFRVTSGINDFTVKVSRSGFDLTDSLEQEACGGKTF